MAVIAAIFCLAVCVSGVMNTAGMCGTSVCYITSQLFSLLHQSTAKQCNCPKEIKFKAKEDSRCVNSDSIVKQRPANGNIFTFSTFSGKLASSLGSLFRKVWNMTAGISQPAWPGGKAAGW